MLLIQRYVIWIKYFVWLLLFYFLDKWKFGEPLQQSRENLARCLMNGSSWIIPLGFLWVWTFSWRVLFTFFLSVCLFFFFILWWCIWLGSFLFSAYRAVYIRRKCGNKQLSSSTYLSEAEPFLEQFAKRSPQNQVLVGSAGNLVRTEDFLAIVEGGVDEEGDLLAEREITLPGPNISVKDTVPKYEGLIVFFPGNCFTVNVVIPNN